MGELIISDRDGVYMINVSGRATFECAPALRNLAKTLESTSFSAIRIDLSQCQWMDSTFMGILAMLALRAKKTGAEISVHNAGKQNTELLYGLGLKKLFQFVDDAIAPVDGANVTDSAAASGSSNPSSYAHTVLEAHETLMDVDEGNVQKFDKVVSLVKQDLERKK